MTADVSTVARKLRGQGEAEAGEGAAAAVTRDFLGGATAAPDDAVVGLDLAVPPGWERRLDLRTGKVYLVPLKQPRADHSLGRPAAAAAATSGSSDLSFLLARTHPRPTPPPTTTGSIYTDIACFVNNRRRPPLPPTTAAVRPPLPPATAAVRPPLPPATAAVCNLDRVRSALERTMRPTSPGASSSSTSTTTSSSSGKRRRCPPEAAAPTLRAAACPACLMYVLVAEATPRCPRCAGTVPLPLAAPVRPPLAATVRPPLAANVRPPLAARSGDVGGRGHGDGKKLRIDLNAAPEETCEE